MFVRYLIAGGFNTLFGYGLFAALNFAFSGHYIYAAILSTLVAITVAFLTYKWFVFRTRGNYLREWSRCMSVYGVMSLIGIAALRVLVPAIEHFGVSPAAPYFAAAIVTGATVIVSFMMHSRFSFNR